MGDFTMPSLGADMEEGTIVEWRVRPGDEVHRGDIVAVVDTEKSTLEVEVFESGVIDAIVVGEGRTVPVGTVLAHVTTTAAAAAPPPPAAPAAAPPPPAAPAAAPPPPAAPAAALPARPAPAAASAPAPAAPALVHSPLVRHEAEALEVDLSHVAGTGPGGVVTRADVEAAAPPPHAGEGSGARISSSPYARRLAGDLDVDLVVVEGTGPDRAVVAADVRRAATGPGGGTAAATVQPAPPRSAPPPSVAPRSADRLQGMRAVTGAAMARSKREIPHYYVSTTIDMGPAVSWLERANLDRSVTDRLVPAVVLLRATALAASRAPEMNGSFVDGAFTPSAEVHLGVAISVRGGGLIAPAIHRADQLSVDELMGRLRDLVTRARGGVLRRSEMSEATLTVTNLGELGVESVLGVIPPPQVALVGFGRIADRPVAIDGMLGVRPCVTASLSADHRVSDGHSGARFLSEIDRLLHHPEEL